MAERTRFRVNLAQRELEVEGSEEFVRSFAERIEELLDRLEEGAASAPARKADLVGLPLFQPNGEASEGEAAEAPSPPPAPVRHGLGPFGEFLHNLPSSSTEVDKMLAAGYFLQQNSTDQTFATGDANKRLSEHGIKIGNPSQCVRQSLMAKRVFMVTRGRYRVSQHGRAYLRQLMGDLIAA